MKHLWNITSEVFTHISQESALTNAPFVVYRQNFTTYTYTVEAEDLEEALWIFRARELKGKIIGINRGGVLTR